MDFKEIDGVRCYAPELSASNTHYPEQFFAKLVAVEDEHFWFRARNKILSYLVNRYAPDRKGVKFLEIGCGTGVVLKHLQTTTHVHLSGAEIHLSGLRFAKMRLPDLEFLQLNAKQMPFNSEYECIGMFDVLEHIDEDELVMKNVHTALCKEGLFFITVPQYPWMWSGADDAAYHQRRYSKKELCTKLERNGFKLIYLSSFVFLLFPVMVLSRFLQKRNSSTAGAELQLNKRLNFLFYKLMQIECWLIEKNIQLPFGGSLICVAQKQ